MNTGTVICSLAIILLTAFSVAEAQQQARVAKIAWPGSRPGSTPVRELFKRELRALGYIEGKNIVFEYRSSEGKLDRLPALAEELVRLNVDVLVMSSTAEGLAAKNATGTIPIVLLGGGDLVADGLVDSLARPGGNITGVTNMAPTLAGKRLELLKETNPNLSRVSVLWNPQGPSSVQQWKESQLAGRGLGLQLHSMEVSSAGKFESAFKEANQARSAALAVTSSPFINSNQRRIAELATKTRLPAIYNLAILSRTVV